jgi:signal peptidase I
VKDFTGEALDFLKDIIIILVIVLVMRTFLVMPFKINGQSMYESYYDKQFIIVDRLSYRDTPLIWKLQEVERGDVVVFAPGVSKDRKYFIKRVIGLPGETIKIQEWKVYLQKIGADDFIEIDESVYLSDENENNTIVRWNTGESIYEIPENRYFVMGDNRNHSTDSRTCFQSCSVRSNYIAPWEIIGKVLIDLGYFNFRTLSFTQPDLDISTKPKFFNSYGSYNYE